MRTPPCTAATGSTGTPPFSSMQPHSRVLWFLAAAVASAFADTVITGSPPHGLGSGLAAAVAGLANHYNTSLSVAVVGAGFEVASAIGVQDHSTGTQTTTHTPIPSGSVTKSWTAIRIMQLHEEGTLDIDTPFHTYVDPWLAAQGRESIKSLWNGDSTIETVTVKQLLQMAGGLGDYNDTALQEWTVAHPNDDYLPMYFIGNLSKRFLYPPGKGAAYSSNGFVLLGMVAAAATNAKTWDQLDQLAATRAMRPLFNNTIFMHRGKCSQYTEVPHQYLLAPPSQTPGAAATCAKTSTWYTKGLVGIPVATYPNVASAGDCCAAANRPPLNFYSGIGWSYHAKSKECSISYQGRENPVGFGAVSAYTVSPKLSSSWFDDLWQDSCLNGWTMGNIASTPSDVARFFHAFSSAKFMKQSTVDSMMPDHVFTSGFAKCSNPAEPDHCLQYGLGIMTFPASYKVEGACTAKGCSCQAANDCSYAVHGFGHAGEDWASGMGTAFYYPALGNITITIADTANCGMNTTLTVSDNMGFSQAQTCPVFKAVLASLGPAYPTLSCSESNTDFSTHPRHTRLLKHVIEHAKL